MLSARCPRWRIEERDQVAFAVPVAVGDERSCDLATAAEAAEDVPADVIPIDQSKNFCRSLPEGRATTPIVCTGTFGATSSYRSACAEGLDAAQVLVDDGLDDVTLPLLHLELREGRLEQEAHSCRCSGSSIPITLFPMAC